MCIGSNSVNQAQDLMSVTKIEDFPNSLIPNTYTLHFLGALVADKMASKNQRKTAKSAASKSYIDQMNELAVSEGVKRHEQAKQYVWSNVTVRKGNTQQSCHFITIT